MACRAELGRFPLIIDINQKIIKSQSARGSKIFGNGQKQPYLKLCLLKACHEQEIKSTIFCLLIRLLSKETLVSHKSNDVSLLNWPSSS